MRCVCGRDLADPIADVVVPDMTVRDAVASAGSPRPGSTASLSRTPDAVADRPGDDRRPLLLIDVDGVLNPIGLRSSDPIPPGFDVHEIDGLRVLLARQHGVWLAELAADFDLAWATSWDRAPSSSAISNTLR